MSRKSSSLKGPWQGPERPPPRKDKRIPKRRCVSAGTGVRRIRPEGDRRHHRRPPPPGRGGPEQHLPHCGRHRPVYDCRAVPRRWRTMDQGPVMAFVEYATVGVECPEHGVVVAAVPWPSTPPRFTREFEQQVAWLACSPPRPPRPSSCASTGRASAAHAGASTTRLTPRPGTASTAWSRTSASTRSLVQEERAKYDGRARHDANRVVWCEGGTGRPCSALLRAAQRGSEGQHTVTQRPTARAG